MDALPPNLTKLINDWMKGDEKARDQAIQLVLPELRRIAGRIVNKQDELQPTALVNEVFIRLNKQLNNQPPSQYNDRNHFIAIAVKAMRHILLDHARKRRAQVSLSEAVQVKVETDDAFTIALEEALSKLEATGVRGKSASRVFELRYFGGLSITEMAEILEISEATIKRRWDIARAWLYYELYGRK